MGEKLHIAEALGRGALLEEVSSFVPSVMQQIRTEDLLCAGPGIQE